MYVKDLELIYDKNDTIKKVMLPYDEYLKISEIIDTIKEDIVSDEDVAFNMFENGIKELKSYGLTLVDISKKLKISQSYLSKILNNRNSISLKTIDKYLDKIDIILEEYYSID